MDTLRLLAEFVSGSARLVSRGNRYYWAWITLLLVLIGSGLLAYRDQVTLGLITTGMRDHVSWGLYIGNFTFLVGVAAAAGVRRGVVLRVGGLAGTGLGRLRVCTV